MSEPWPTCPKDGNPVAAAKDGAPLKHCEAHTDRRPSAKQRQKDALAARTADRLKPAGQNGNHALSVGPSGVITDPVLDERPTGAAAQLAGGQRIAEETTVAEPVTNEPIAVVEAVTGAPFDSRFMAADKVVEAVLAGTFTIPVRLHKKHGYLATVPISDRTLYRYGADEAIARARMLDGLQMLAQREAQTADLQKRAKRAKAAADRAAR